MPFFRVTVISPLSSSAKGPLLSIYSGHAVGDAGGAFGKDNRLDALVSVSYEVAGSVGYR